jgi:hypothetical protein
MGFIYSLTYIYIHAESFRHSVSRNSVTVLRLIFSVAAVTESFRPRLRLALDALDLPRLSLKFVRN